METEQPKPLVTGLTPHELIKLINPEQEFKFSNWIQWLENEKSKRRHATWILVLAVIAMSVMAGLFVYGATINLISKETLTALLGTLVGFGSSVFIKHIEKPDKN